MLDLDLIASHKAEMQSKMVWCKIVPNMWPPVYIVQDVFILVTGGVAAGALCSTIEVIYGRRKARRGYGNFLRIRAKFLSSEHLLGRVSDVREHWQHGMWINGVQ